MFNFLKKKTRLEKAIELALRWHRGQKDKANEEYVLHPLRVMSTAATYSEKIVAVLHDIFEDTAISVRTVKGVVNEEELEALITLTKRREESYHDYLLRVRENKLARRVKLLDLEDNLLPNRLSKLTPQMAAYLERKYRNASLMLRSSMVFKR